MKKNVLCIKNGNPYIEEALAFIKEQGFSAYELNGFDREGLQTILQELDAKGEGLDLFLMGVDESIAADGDIYAGHDDLTMAEHLASQVNGMRNCVFDALPLMRKADGKRIALITSANSSVSYNTNTENYTMQMAMAGMNMVGHTFFNLLRPEGFTFRWYCASTQPGGISAGEYVLTNFCYDAGEPYKHSEENKFVMRDAYFREIPW